MTRERVQEIATWGLALKPAAKAAGVSYSTLRRRADKYGIVFEAHRPGRLAHVPVEVMRDMAARGLTIPQAAAETGEGEKYLRKRARDCGVWLGKTKRGPALDAIPRPARPSKNPVTSSPAYAQKAAEENARMHAEMRR